MWNSESGVNLRLHNALTPNNSKRRREIFRAKIKVSRSLGCKWSDLYGWQGNKFWKVYTALTPPFAILTPERFAILTPLPGAWFHAKKRMIFSGIYYYTILCELRICENF